MCKHILIQSFSVDDIALLKAFTERTNEHDGYGAIIRRKSGKVETLKSLDCASFYLDLSPILLSGDVSTLVVHHRTSTNKRGLDYAHPFEFLGNYLTHNGVVFLPDKHDTVTDNDSEALLHHLVKTGFKTSNISGYFSCFILNASETHVLVDRTAPIYGDGRVYSSHFLKPEWSKIEARHLVFNTEGKLTHDAEIEIKASDYGQEFKHLSLSYTDDLPYLGASQCEPFDYGDTDPDPFNRFLDVIPARFQYNLIDSKKPRAELLAEIVELAATYGIELEDETPDEILEYLAG